MPTVDVLMPVREPAPWLDEALAGLARQDDVDWNLVLVVHGPDMSTTERVAAWALPTTVCHVGAELTLPEVLDVGLAACRAPLVARIDSDDVPLPGRLAEACRRLSIEPGLTMVVSRAALIDPAGTSEGMSPPVESELAVVRAMRWRNVIVHSSVTFRRGEILALGGYSSRAIQVEDYDLWLRILAHGRIGVVPEILVQHRVHPDQVSVRRAIPAAAARAVGESRVDLARARGESESAARFRQWVWSTRQAARRRRRG